MKVSVAILASIATAVSASALSADGWQVKRADEIDFSKVEIVDLVVTDFDGTEYSGTAQTIYDEIKEHNGLVAPEALSSDVGKRGVAKRSINCNWGAQIGSWNQCIEGMTYLMNLGDRRCGVNATPPGQPAVCARVSCSRSCGIFLCNKQNNHFTVRCGDIPRDVNEIASTCQDTFGRIRGAKDFSGHYIALGQNSC